MKRLDRTRNWSGSKLGWLTLGIGIIGLGAAVFGANQEISVVRLVVVILLCLLVASLIAATVTVGRIRRVANAEVSEINSHTDERIQHIRQTNAEVVAVFENRVQQLSGEVLAANEAIIKIRRQISEIRRNNSELRLENAKMRQQIGISSAPISSVYETFQTAESSVESRVESVSKPSSIKPRTYVKVEDIEHTPVIIDLGEAASPIITNTMARRAK